MYSRTAGSPTGTMIERTQSVLLFAVYQLSLLVGIALLPVALAAKRVGFTLPVHRAVERLGTAYERKKGV